MRLRRFLQSRRGAISIITALSSVGLIGFAGFAVDLGSVYLESRRLQGAADLAALAAIQNPGAAEHTARATVSDNRWPGARVVVTPGAYAAERNVHPRDRFVAHAPSANALRVEVSAAAPLFFGRLFIPEGRMTITRRATAAQTRMASFQIGSRLLAVRGGVANEVLGALTGSTVDLSVMDYDALLQADVELFSFVSALRTRLELRTASFDETLARRMEAPVALAAIADTFNGENPRAERVLRRLASAAQRAGQVDGLHQLLDLGPYGAQDQMLSGATEVRVSALDLATAILQIAGGDRQVRLQLGAGVPGLASTEVWLAIGERPNNSPWLTITDDRDVIVRTAQTRLYVNANVAPGGALGPAQVRIPILLELASAEARLADIQCTTDGRGREVTLSVAPSIGSLSLGEIDVSRLDDFRTTLRPSRATLVRAGLAQVEGEARVELGGREWRDVRFSGQDIERGLLRRISTRDAVRATVSSLLGNTQLYVRAGGLSLNAGVLTSLTRGALTTAAGPLDGLLNGVTDLLGVRLGEADVRVNGVRCGGAALVA